MKRESHTVVKPEGSRILEGKRICFIGRGGAGKSTCLVLTAECLCAAGYEVCILDADSTNVGLQKALETEGIPEPLVDYFGGMVFQGGKVSCPVDDPSLIAEPMIDLDRLPRNYQSKREDGITLLQAGKLADFGLGAGCDGPMVKIARDVRIKRGVSPVVLLVDFKAGLEDTSRGALVGMDAIVVVCDPSAAAIRATIALNGLLEAQRTGAQPATAHLETPALMDLMRQLYRQWRPRRLHVVLNKVSEHGPEEYIREQLAKAGIEIAASIPDMRLLREAWLRETRLGREAADYLNPLVEQLEKDLDPVSEIY